MRVEYEISLKVPGSPRRPRTWQGSCPDTSLAFWVAAALADALTEAKKNAAATLAIVVRKDE